MRNQILNNAAIKKWLDWLALRDPPLSGTKRERFDYLIFLTHVVVTVTPEETPYIALQRTHAGFGRQRNTNRKTNGR